MNDRRENWSRRGFVGGLTVAGTAGLVGRRPDVAIAEPPPETTRLRLIAVGSTCVAPQYVAAEEMFRSEGFSDVRYLKAADGKVVPTPGPAMASGDFDIVVSFITVQISLIEAGAPVVILAGGHVGCIELFAKTSIRSLRDLKGKIVAVSGGKNGLTPGYAFLASFVASVGLDARRDLEIVAQSAAESTRLFAEGKIDAFIMGPPESQAFRAKKIGHVLFDNGRDRPWSQYFCCMVAGHREFVRRNPVATKRALRAILKANHVCAVEPERVAKSMVDKDYAGAGRAGYEHVLQGLKELRYGTWREYDAEDAVRFYAIRLHEAGLIKASPQKILAQGTDWRFLTELKKELKG